MPKQKIPIILIIILIIGGIWLISQAKPKELFIVSTVCDAFGNCAAVQRYFTDSLGNDLPDTNANGLPETVAGTTIIGEISIFLYDTNGLANDMWYWVEEKIPTGWTVTPNTFNYEAATNTLRKIEVDIEPLTNPVAVYTYNLNIPPSQGPALFDFTASGSRYGVGDGPDSQTALEGLSLEGDPGVEITCQNECLFIFSASTFTYPNNYRTVNEYTQCAIDGISVQRCIVDAFGCRVWDTTPVDCPAGMVCGGNVCQSSVYDGYVCAGCEGYYDGWTDGFERSKAKSDFETFVMTGAGLTSTLSNYYYGKEGAQLSKPFQGYCGGGGC